MPYDEKWGCQLTGKTVKEGKRGEFWNFTFTKLTLFRENGITYT